MLLRAMQPTANKGNSASHHVLGCDTKARTGLKDLGSCYRRRAYVVFSLQESLSLN
jgi:hypothetical protein